MTAIVCVLLTAAGCYLAFGLGHLWWLAWLAPVPVLWLAFGRTESWKAFLAAWAALALGLASLEHAYGGVLPAPVLALDILLPSLVFAAAVSGARRVAVALGPVAAMLAFGTLWAGLDLLLTLLPGIGSMLSPAGAEVGAPALIQIAALVGFAGVTFLLGTVAAGIALSGRTRNPTPILIAAGLLAANAAYGYWRISQPPMNTQRVALIDSNTYGYWAPSAHAHEPAAAVAAAALRVVDAYASQIESLRGQHVRLVVLPENIAPIDGTRRDQALAKLSAAANMTGATVVAGFESLVDGARRNVALAFAPGVSQPAVYEKRQLVPGLETRVFAPGTRPLALPDGTGVEICLDMDSPGMIRRDEVATRPEVLAVPASEIGTHGNWADLGTAADGWFHARDAMLRSVEDGVPMARSAGRGLLTLSDRYGRVIAESSTTAGFTTLVGNLPLAGHGGATLYDRIGDLFGWLCLTLGLSLVAASWRRGTRNATAVQGCAYALLSCALAMSLALPAAAHDGRVHAATSIPAPTYKVGVASRRFVPPEPYDWRDAQTHALIATVWYPAAPAAEEEPQWIGESPHPFARAGRAAPDAALASAPRRFPLIVMSHGTGGSALALAWLGTRLAAHGYIAVAVNHPGNNSLEPYTARGFTLWWLRAGDLSAVIDGMLADRRFGPRIDPRRIGAAGFSLGGYTMIEIAGGRTSPALFDFCRRHPRDRRCASPPEFPTLVSQVVTLLKSDATYRAEIAEAGESHRDPRVRAVFAIAPALGPAFVPASLHNISIPVEILAGTADTIEPVGVNARYFAAHIPGSRLILFPGAGHYTFFAICTATGRKALPGICTDVPGIDRQRIHEQAADRAVAFFSKRLR